MTAPDGYTLNTSYVEIKVDSNTAYQIDPISGDAVIEVVYENHPVKGELVIRKSGEVLSGFGKDFSYEMADLAGAVFIIYAAEDIYTADHQVDEAGNRTLEYVMNAPYKDCPARPSRFYLDGILEGCEQNGIPKKPILKAAEQVQKEVKSKNAGS